MRLRSKAKALVLPDSVSSPQDVTALSLEIHEYARWFSHNDIKKRVHARHASPSPDLTPAAKELIHTWEARGKLDVRSLDSLIKQLREHADKAPVMTITLAAPASGDLKQKLVGWCRKNVDPNVLVNFDFNSTLLGGMVVRYGSHVFDWSFRRQILSNAGKFPEVLRNV
jgi:hypothetical protein